ncbi:hypothetical protein TIFTF001_022342 [Ficus carica]|uniref:Uncharacterized protein n=1 Tax=Ficus carica TaxID=3494 RepID=A0AA88DBL9_FICCA|nr:hypothetical protein TIFTF001_022342 [Ficus carica]
MREIGDSSSAGSTPPPSNLENFSPSHFFIDDPLSPRPPLADDDLWKHLESDGWCFFSDNNHHDSQQLFNVGRSTVSEPFRPMNADCRRPPHPSRGVVTERRKRKHLGMERRDGAEASCKHSGIGHQLRLPDHDQGGANRYIANLLTPDTHRGGWVGKGMSAFIRPRVVD